jgi:Flp pilus assembly protein TadD
VHLKIGDTSIARSYTLRADGVLEVLSRIDTGKRRITAAEFADLRDGLVKHRKIAPEFLSFVPLTTDLLALGKTSEAIATVNSLVAATPGRAIAHIRRSKVLLSLGLGLPARTEAIEATKLEPNLSVAWLAAGLAWQHSATGKSFVDDWRRDEAERAYRKAIELDPSDNLARISLAILLEHDRRGFRYTTGTQLKEAAELYRKALESQENAATQPNLALVLLYAGDFEAAREEIKKCSPDNQVFVELILAAAQHGASRVLTDPRLATVPAESRAAIFWRTAFSLLVFRKYPDVKAFTEAAGRLTGNAGMRSLSAVVGDLRRHEELLVSPEDPRFPVQRLIIGIANGEVTRESMAPHISSFLPWNEEIATLDIDSVFRSWRGSEMFSAGLTNEVLLDFILGKSMEYEGDDTSGYKVTAMLAGAPQFFVIREDDGYKLIGGPGGLEGVGNYVLHLLDQGKVAAAQGWLDKVLSAAKQPDNPNDLPAVRALWSGVGDAARGPAAIRLAAASLIGTYSQNPVAIKMLVDDRLKAKTEFDRAMIDLALAEAYAKRKDWKSLLPVAKRLTSTRQYSQRGFAYTLRAATELEDWPELEAAGALGFASNQRNQNAIEAVITARTRMGDLRAAREWLARLKGDPDNGGGSDRILDNRMILLDAWIAMYSGAANSELLTRLEELSKDSTRFPYGMEGHLTIAMMRAVLNKPGDAVEPLLRALGEESSLEPNVTFWTVYSRICRDLGFPQAAEEAAALARKSTRTDDYTDWARAIAKI